jgi:hypothetical protein
MPIKVRGMSGQVHEFYGCKPNRGVKVPLPEIFEAKDVTYVVDFYEHVDENIVASFYAKWLDTGVVKGEIRYWTITKSAKEMAKFFGITLVRVMPLEE